MIQSDLELLRPLWMPKSFDASENCKQTLKLWLMEGNYYVNNSPPELSLFCQVADDVKKCFSLDAFRFGMHAAQTFFELERTSAYQKLTSWRVIQTYYAAYFSAHAILRFFGLSFSHLEYGHVRFLIDRCQTEVGYSPSVASSYYLISLSPNDKIISFEKFGESHRDLWKCFLKLIQDISSQVLTLRASEERRQSFSKKFSDMADALTLRGRHSAGNWLSVVRNEVNYKSLHGTWYPFSKNNPNFDDLMSKVKDWRTCSNDMENPNNIRNELERFFMTAFCVIDLCLSMGVDYQKISEKAGRRSADFSRLIKASAAAA